MTCAIKKSYQFTGSFFVLYIYCINFISDQVVLPHLLRLNGFYLNK